MIKKSLRKELINGKIKRITELLEVIEEHLPKEFEDFKSSRLIRDAVYKEVEGAIEYVLDVCNIINSDLLLGVPETEEDIIKHLEDKKVINKNISQIIGEMKGFRNILVHKYGEIDDEIAFEEIRKGIADFETIVKEFEDVLKRFD